MCVAEGGRDGEWVWKEVIMDERFGKGGSLEQDRFGRGWLWMRVAATKGGCCKG
jgi:hypothetical protein